MTSQGPINQNDAWNRIYNSCPFRIWNKTWGSMDILKSYGEFKICLFSQFFPFLAHLRALGFWGLARAYYVIIGQEGLEISLKCWEYYWEPKTCKKTAFPHSVRATHGKTPARTRTRGIFENAPNGLKRIVHLKWSNLEHFKILTRAYAYVKRRAQKRVR